MHKHSFYLYIYLHIIAIKPTISYVFQIIHFYNKITIFNININKNREY